MISSTSTEPQSFPSLQVNDLSALLLTMLLIPAAQRAAAARPGSNPRLVIVGSDIHYFADMPKKVINAPSGKVLHELNKHLEKPRTQIASK